MRFDRAREAGLTEDKVADITDGYLDSDLPEAYKAALAWADLMLAGGSQPSTELEAELRAHFDAAQIVELTYAMGSFIGYSKQIIALGVEPEVMDVTVLPAPA